MPRTTTVAVGAQAGNERRERRVAQNGSEAGPLVAGVAGRYASALFELARDVPRCRCRRGGRSNRFDALLQGECGSAPAW